MLLSYMYLSLMKRLQERVPGIKHIDLFNNQFIMEGEEMPRKCPAVLIEFKPIIFKSVGNRRQEGEMNIDIHIGSEVIQEVSSRENERIRDKGLSHLELVDKVTNATMGFTDNDVFGTITRTGYSPDNNHDKVKVDIVSFKCRVVDDAGKRKMIKKTTPTEQDLTINTLPDQEG